MGGLARIGVWCVILALWPYTQISAKTLSSPFRLYANSSKGTKSIAGGGLSLVMQTDGNMVLYESGSKGKKKKPIWASNTSGRKCSKCYAAFQGDGNLVVYDPSYKGNKHHAIWASNTDGRGAKLRIADGGIQILNTKNQIVWAGRAFILHADPKRGPQAYVKDKQILIMQTDGNLVLYESGSKGKKKKPVWASNTSGRKCSKCYAAFQGDGNLVVYDPSYKGNKHHAIWASNTDGRGARFKLTSNRIEIRNRSNVVIWYSGSAAARSTAASNPPRAASSSTSASGQSGGASVPACVPVQFGLFNRQSTPIDFLDQTVCDDGYGNATAFDPGPGGTLCPCGSGNARKINVGEKLPYHKYDRLLAQISDSFRLPDADGRLRVLQTMFWTMDLPTYGQVYFNPNRGGYSVLAAEGNHIGIIGTYDQTGGLQPFYSPGCSMNDSWILFPKSFGVSPNQTYSWISSPNCNFPAGATAGVHANSVTSWTARPELVTYSNGRQLYTVVVYHYAVPTKAIDAIKMDDVVSGELFYFTREYGMTRWEAWQSTVNNPRGANTTPFYAGCNGLTSTTWGYTNSAVRVDCHDWTEIKPAPAGGWSPANWSVHSIFTN
ncbi:MAG: hypothetical protein AB7G93_23470 [Bdellovibrionales bacterium]